MKDLKELWQSITKEKLSESRPKMIALSLLLAIATWSSVVLSADSTFTTDIQDIPVTIPLTGASYQALGLEVIDDGRTYTASVQVSGSRSVVGALTADSIVVTPDFSVVTEAGTYNLTLTAQKKNQLMDYEIVSVTPMSLKLTFGEATNRKFAVTPQVTGISVEEGYVLQSIVSSPTNVAISGASDVVSRIDRVVAQAELNEKLTASRTVTATLHLYDAQGNEIPSSSVRMETSEVELTVPVYKEGVMPLEIGFLNIPDGFDASILPYTLSRNSIRVASSEANIAALQSRVVGYIDLANFDADGRYSFDIELPSGWANLDSVKSVDVVFDVSGLASKVITVSDIRVENVPAGTDISVLTDSIRNVTVFGDAAVVQRLLPTSVVAVVDADEIVLQQGSYNVPVHFRIPGVYNVWVTGSYTVTIEAESGQ